MWAFGLFLFLLGLILMIAAPINKRKNTRCSMKTQGLLCQMTPVGRRGNRYVYGYSVDGVVYQIASTILSKEANNVGDPCTIWYDPKKPKNAQPFHYESLKIYRILFLIGIIAFFAGIVLIVYGAARGSM